MGGDVNNAGRESVADKPDDALSLGVGFVVILFVLLEHGVDGRGAGLLGSLRVRLAGVHAAQWGAAEGNAHSTEGAADSAEARSHGYWASTDTWDESRATERTHSWTAEASAQGWVIGASRQNSRAQAITSSDCTHTWTAEASAQGWVKGASRQNSRAQAITSSLREATSWSEAGTLTREAIDWSEAGTLTREAINWGELTRQAIINWSRAATRGIVSWSEAGTERVAIRQAIIHWSRAATRGIVSWSEASTVRVAIAWSEGSFRRLVFAVVLGVGTLVERQG